MQCFFIPQTLILAFLLPAAAWLGPPVVAIHRDAAVACVEKFRKQTLVHHTVNIQHEHLQQGTRHMRLQ
jgi:hypothetical protein